MSTIVSYKFTILTMVHTHLTAIKICFMLTACKYHEKFAKMKVTKRLFELLL